MALSRVYLDAAKCGTPGCENCTHAIYIHSKCHPHSPVDANYDKRTGWLVFRCRKCSTLVCEIEVAK